MMSHDQKGLFYLAHRWSVWGWASPYHCCQEAEKLCYCWNFI